MESREIDGISLGRPVQRLTNAEIERRTKSSVA
jgi:hypothetical protein